MTTIRVVQSPAMLFFPAIAPRPPVRLVDMTPALVALPATLLVVLFLPRFIEKLADVWRRFRLTDAPLCRKCGYDTRGLPGPICPSAHVDYYSMISERPARWLIAGVLWGAGTLILWKIHRRWRTRELVVRQ